MQPTGYSSGFRLLFTFLLLGAASLVAQCDLQWVAADGLPGADDRVVATTLWDPDGAGPAGPVVVVGGSFERVGSLAAPSVAAWDPATGAWSALGAGIPGFVNALVVLPNGDLVAAGSMVAVPSGGVIDLVVRWDGANWVPLGFGTSGSVGVMRVLSNGNLLVGGDFTSAGGVAATSLAVWNGVSWTAFGSPGGLTLAGGSPQVGALLELASGDVVVAGRFDTTGGVATNCIARWDGTTWHPFGAGVSATGFNRIRALHVQPNGDIIAGGLFALIGAATGNCIARWDGSAWHPMGGGATLQVISASGGVHSFASRPNGDLVAGGYFTKMDGVSAYGIAQWNGTSWSPLAAGGLAFTQLALSNGDLIAGGDFTGHGEHVSRWDGASWHALSRGFNDGIGPVIELPNGNLVVGGRFTHAGATPAARIALHDGVDWQPLGSGLTSNNQTLIPRVGQIVRTPGGDLIVSGVFTHAGGVPAANIARWNGTAWSALPGGAVPTVGPMLLRSNGDLVVAGLFSTIGGIAANRIARWDGAVWHPMAAGLDGEVMCLAESPSGELVAGGKFTTAGGVVVNRVARWDGTSWSAMGGGLTQEIYRLVVMPDGSLVATGLFSLNQRWDGTAWSPFGTGAPGTLGAPLPLPNGDLLAFGSSSPGTYFMARCSGGVWTTLPVAPITVSSSLLRRDGTIVVCGSFTTVPGAPSAYLARLEPTCLATSQPLGTGCTSSGGSNSLVATTLPWVDATFCATGTGLPATAIVIATTSVTSIAQGAAPLAALLPPQGVPGCDLLVQPDILEVMVTTTGSATSSLYLPSTPPLVGAIFYHQMVPIELDVLGNWVAITATNALQLTAGQL